MNQLTMAISTFNRDQSVLNLRRYFGEKSFVSVLGKDRLEAVHSNFLAWLFQYDESDECGQQLGAFTVKRLFQLILGRRETGQEASNSALNREENRSIVEAIRFDTLQVQHVSVQTEIVNKHDKKRCDLVLTCNIVDHVAVLNKTIRIVIENKVESLEHDKQTMSYYDEWSHADNKDHGLTLFVFLTPIPSRVLDDFSTIPETETCRCHEFVHICYQDIFDYILAPLMKVFPLIERNRFFVNEYVRTLQQTTVKQEGVMAVTEAEKKLAQDFLEVNRDLLGKIMLILREDEECGEDDRKMLGKIAEYITTRNYDKVIVDGQAYPKNQGVRAIIYAFVREHDKQSGDVTIQLLQKTFPRKLQGPFEIILPLAEANQRYQNNQERLRQGGKDVAKTPRRYFPDYCTLKNGENFCVCNQWGENTPGFVKYAAGLGVDCHMEHQ